MEWDGEITPEEEALFLKQLDMKDDDPMLNMNL